MATPNYGFEKRQKELAKKRKKEEKLKEKAARKHAGPDDGAREAVSESEPQNANDAAAKTDAAGPSGNPSDDALPRG